MTLPTRFLLLAPTIYPVTLEEAKIHLRLEDSDEEDLLIENLIIAATEQAEKFLDRKLITQTWQLFADNFWSEELTIPYPPLQSVTHIKYYDSGGTLTTMPGADYVVDTKKQPGRIVAAPNLVWPSVEADRINAVEIQFVCGYGADGSFVPGSIKAAILLMIAHFFEHRQEVIVGTISSEINKNAEWLMWPFRDLRDL